MKSVSASTSQEREDCRPTVPFIFRLEDITFLAALSLTEFSVF